MLHRLVDANLSNPQPQPTCGTPRPVDASCTACGVDPRGPAAPLPAGLSTQAGTHWHDSWQRTAQKPRISPQV